MDPRTGQLINEGDLQGLTAEQRKAFIKIPEYLQDEAQSVFDDIHNPQNTAPPTGGLEDFRRDALASFNPVKAGKNLSKKRAKAINKKLIKTRLQFAQIAKKIVPGLQAGPR